MYNLLIGVIYLIIFWSVSYWGVQIENAQDFYKVVFQLFFLIGSTIHFGILYRK